MPRHFTPEDRIKVRAQLLEAGLRHFGRYGLRGMRVDDVCREVGVAKGTFYNFFPHKEALFLAIAEDRDAMHKSDMLEFLAGCDGDAPARIGKFFDLLTKKLLTDPLIAIVAVPEDFGALLRKVPPGWMEKEEERDLRFIAGFCDTLRERGLIGPVDPRDIAGLMGLLVCLVLQKAILSPDQFATSSALLREMFVVKLTGGPA